MKNTATSIHIANYILALKNGGTYLISKVDLAKQLAAAADDSERLRILAEINRSKEANHQAATRYGRYLERQRIGNSKYSPHQGTQECARRLRRFKAA